MVWELIKSIRNAPVRSEAAIAAICPWVFFLTYGLVSRQILILSTKSAFPPRSVPPLNMDRYHLHLSADHRTTRPCFVWLTPLFAINVQIRMLSPPLNPACVGPNSATPKDITLQEIFLDVLPFTGLPILGLALVIKFPKNCPLSPKTLKQAIMDTRNDKSEIDDFGWRPQIASAATVTLFGSVPDPLRPRPL